MAVVAALAVGLAQWMRPLVPLKVHKHVHTAHTAHTHFCLVTRMHACSHALAYAHTH